MQHRKLGCTCAHVFQKKPRGALIGAGALNRANTVIWPVYNARGLMSHGGCDLRLLEAEDCRKIPNHVIEAVRKIEDRKHIEHAK